MVLSVVASNPDPAPSDGELLDAYSSTIAAVADRVGPAVAAVISKGRGMGSGLGKTSEAHYTLHRKPK